MIKLPKALALLILGSFLTFPSYVAAETIASQTKGYENSLDVWQLIQELGSNLSGTAASFTFRVSTSKSNLAQFDHTATNTKIYDKTTNTFISGCITPTDKSDDYLKGLTFITSGVPQGYQDVTIDFSCNNYSFIPGHKYLIKIGNANFPNEGVGKILFGAVSYSGTANDYYPDAGLRYANGNKFDFSHNGGVCNPISYKWGDLTQNPKSGCNIWTTPKDDIYFVLKNTTPEPTPTPTPAPVLSKNPVIFIPGIGGSELKASQDIVWSKDNNHGGTFSYAYKANEKIWINQDEAAQPLGDDYFDVLRLKEDGVAPEADLNLTGNLVHLGYGDIEPFFESLGYIKNIDFFIFPYDWRKDIRLTKDSLDNLVETTKTTSGKPQVNIVTHSMGGLVARYYISDSTRASKIGKLIELGAPHLGSVDALKTIVYGSWLGYDFKLITLGIPPSETKDVFQNLPSAFQLLPSNKYYDFYKNTNENSPYPFRDERDIDNNKVIGNLNFNQIKTLLNNLAHNMTVFTFGEQFHDLIDPNLSQANGTKISLIAGSGQPTLGQIKETWWITWPINLIPKTEEVFINGDETVPLYSASLKNESLDISGAEKIYYVEQTHGNLVSKDGTAMQTVKAILNEGDLPTEVKSEKIYLEGYQLSLDDGELELYDEENNHTGIKNDEEIETNIPETFYSTSNKAKHAFIKKKAKKVKVKTTRNKLTSSDPKTTNLKILSYKEDKIIKTTVYKDIPITQTAKIEFDLDPTIDTPPTLTLFPDSAKTDSINITFTSDVSGATALDQIPPATEINQSGTNPITITLTGTDSDSGILKIEYSLDNGQTVQTYTEPFTISTIGKTTLQVKSIDKTGNEEIPQEKVIEISSTPSSSNSSSDSSSNSSSSSDSSSNNQPSSSTSDSTENNSNTNYIESNKQSPADEENTQDNNQEVLGTSINNQQSKEKIINHSILGGLLMATIGLQGILPFFTSSIMTFLKPSPK